MVKLQDKCKLMKLRPLRLIARKPAWMTVNIENDDLVYQETRNATHEGYCTLSDIKGERYRKKKVLESLTGDTSDQLIVERINQQTIHKFGQVRPWPINFSLKFPWKGARSKSTSDLKELLRQPPTTSLLDLPLKIKDEIVEHVVLELFHYFRRSVPSRNIEKALELLLSEFPWMNDECTYNGLVRLDHLLLICFTSSIDYTFFFPLVKLIMKGWVASAFNTFIRFRIEKFANSGRKRKAAEMNDNEQVTVVAPLEADSVSQVKRLSLLPISRVRIFLDVSMLMNLNRLMRC